MNHSLRAIIEEWLADAPVSRARALQEVESLERENLELRALILHMPDIPDEIDLLESSLSTIEHPDSRHQAMRFIAFARAALKKRKEILGV